MKETTFISFIGSRGSGKTTVADATYDLLEQRGYTVQRQHVGLVRRPLGRALYNAIMLWRFFDFTVMKYFGFYGRTRRTLPSIYRLYLPLALMHDLHQVVTHRADVLIYDSNILRGIMSAMSQPDFSEDAIREVYKTKIASKVDKVILVVVETDSAEAVRRWQLRDDVHLSPEQYEQEVERRTNEKRVVDATVNLIAAIPNVSVITLDGFLLPAENAAFIAQEVVNS